MMWPFSHYGWMGWGFGFLSPIFSILAVFLLVGFIVSVVRSGRESRGGGEGSKGDTHMQILKERYAKGEIDKKQFEEMKKDLS